MSPASFISNLDHIAHQSFLSDRGWAGDSKTEERHLTSLPVCFVAGLPVSNVAFLRRRHLAERDEIIYMYKVFAVS